MATTKEITQMETIKIPQSDIKKYAAARAAIEYVHDGMSLGLGTGSTAYWFVILLAKRIREEGLQVECVTTSSATYELAASYGVPLTTLDELPELDLVVDGADEVSHQLELIKGGGAALLQEKIVANASAKMVVIADMPKYVKTLGKFLLPVEVVRFGATATAMAVEDVLAVHDVKGSTATWRMRGDAPLITDEGHYILDCACEEINNPAELNAALNMVPGVVENGLFIGLADTAIMGDEDGNVSIATLDKDGVGKIGTPIAVEMPENMELTL